MNKYNPKAKCPKCGYKDINGVYRKKGDWCVYHGYYQKMNKSVIERICKYCGYYWDEIPLDEGKDE